MYLELVGGVIGAAEPLTGIRDAFAGAAAVLRETDYIDACPIATVALEVASSNEPLRIATAEVFESWIAGLTALFTGAGIAPEPARDLAIVLIELLEGGFLLSRASRTTDALDAAGAAAVTLVEAALVRAAPGAIRDPS
jgi:AcrR family transcriptional regulator